MTKKIALKWLRQAFHDLEMSEKNIGIGGYDIASFLAHQSVEKLLKAIFAVRGKKIPRTHHIDELARELKLSPDILEAVSDLTVDYTFARYPDVSDRVPFEEYDESLAAGKVMTAKRIFDSLKELHAGIMEK